MRLKRFHEPLEIFGDSHLPETPGKDQQLLTLEVLSLYGIYWCEFKATFLGSFCLLFLSFNLETVGEGGGDE